MMYTSKLKNYDLMSAMIGALMGGSMGTISKPIFDQKALKKRQAELEICAEYGIARISDDEDAESEYIQAIAEIENEPVMLNGRQYILAVDSIYSGGTTDKISDRYDYKRMYTEAPIANYRIPMGWEDTLETHDDFVYGNYINAVDVYNNTWEYSQPMFCLPEETDYEKKFNQFMRTKAQEYVSENGSMGTAL